MSKKSVLLILTGGTISMAENPETGALIPVDFESVDDFLPELKRLNITINIVPLLPLVDSSHVGPQVWERIALVIKEYYDNYDGFVVLHGTDTMSYSASALSFMLDGLTKAVIFTGSQLPIGVLRTDAKENLITSIEIAATYEQEKAMVPEVCVYFEGKLFRANRTTKHNSENFNAFKSFNYPVLAEAGVHIRFFKNYIHRPALNAKLRVHTKTDQNIAIIKLFPGIMEQTVLSILQIPNLKAVVLETFGAGNAPDWIYKPLKEATDKGIIIVNKTQCSTGTVEMGLYESSLHLLNAGVISGHDITIEAVVAKLMYLLGGTDDVEKVKELMKVSLCGEMTIE